ncbi:hypothetical protein G9A89_005061 [Geosiphon pyriformis]|nr:hypothetical protein G9A89_005061 [Geosiphon pyriformis]
MELKNNLYNNLVHYSQLETEDLNSETLATYFQELNFNIIEYCEEKYPVQPKYSLDFESETETSNKGKQKVKQYSRTTPNTLILPKTTTKYLQTPEQRTSIKLPLSIIPFPISLARPQTPSLPFNCFSRPENFQSPRNPTQQQEPISTSTNIIEYLQENKSNYSENLESEETELEPEKIPENEEEMTTAYIAKIPEFTTRMLKAIPYFLQGTTGKWFENLEKSFENWQAFKDAFLQQFTDNNTSITLQNCFCNIKQKTSETFIAELKDKFIKKVRPHAPENLATAIRHAKNYEIAMEEANHTKLTNSQKRLKATLPTNNNSSNNHKNTNPHNDTIKTILDHHLTTKLKIVIIMEFQDTGNRIAKNCKKTNKIGVINITLHHNNLITNLKTTKLKQLILTSSTTNTATISAIFTNSAISNTTHLTILNTSQKIESIQITSWFLKILVNKDPVTITLNPVTLQCLKNRIFNNLSNPFNNTIPSAQIAQNANLSDIFPFEFEANESLFLLSNTAANEQKTITVMYTEATVEGKPIQLILDSGSAGSIITYQLIQQLQKTVDRPAQTVIVTANSMKKTSVREIDNFPFTIDGITIPVKVLVMDALQYQALVGNDWLLKANANLDWKTQELKISY